MNIDKRIHTIRWYYRFCSKQPACWIIARCPFGYLGIGSCCPLKCYMVWYDVCPSPWCVSWFVIRSQNSSMFCRHFAVQWCDGRCFLRHVDWDTSGFLYHIIRKLKIQIKRMDTSLNVINSNTVNVDTCNTYGFTYS